MTPDLEVVVKYKSNFKKLSKQWACFEELFNCDNIEKDHRKWNRNNSVSYDLQCVFLGKTGYGKSTTLNTIVGKKVFQTSDVKSTTRTAQSAEWILQAEKNWWFSIADMPGIGECKNSDLENLKHYKDILEVADCVVYFLRADQRDFAVDIETFNKIKIDKKKLIIGLNCCDKIEPLNRGSHFQISHEQHHNIQKVKENIASIFSVSQNIIVDYSATEKWRIEYLLKTIVNVITKNL